VGSLAGIFNEKGYETAFFHGGNNGTMSFDAFANLAAFKGYYGHTEYMEYDDTEKYYEGYWGIYDHAFLQYVAWKMNSFKQPFFALEFTLSSHNPYKVPDGFEEKFPETDVKILRVIRYTDYALRQFFKEASKMPWFKNTLFVISADHPGHSFSEQENNRMQDEDEKLSDYDIKYYNNTVGSYAIPILFYFPGDSLHGTNNSTMQQSDIMPSVLDYLKCNSPFMAFGSSVFSDSSDRVAFQYVSGFYQITQGKYSLMFDGERSLSLFNNMEDPEHQIDLIDIERDKVREMENLIKAVIQQYNYRMENNQLHL
jgi:phosphoglycerol transferase MdoB-like AlkP superfamily enzyme